MNSAKEYLKMGRASNRKVFVRTSHASALQRDTILDNLHDGFLSIHCRLTLAAASIPPVLDISFEKGTF